MNQRGFSLVEVLLAAALMSLTMAAVVTMAITAQRSNEESGQLTTAVSLTQQRIEWLRQQGYSSLSAGTIVESLSGDFAGYQRTTVIKDDTPDAGIREITVTTTSPVGRQAQFQALIAN